MVGMQPNESYIRRSRLNPMTYSMCCHVPRIPRRLPTFTLPATAPTVSSPNGWTRRCSESVSTTVSASTMTMSSFRASATPVLSAVALPAGGTLTTRTLSSPSPSTTSAVPVAREVVQRPPPSTPGCAERASDCTAGPIVRCTL
jgi:hypothetical protein